MKKSLKILLLGVTIFVFLTTSVSAIGDYQINWWTIDGGGGTSESSGGQYVLKGTIGQHDANDTNEGGTYSLRGGFWVEGILAIYEYIINLPLVLRLLFSQH